MVRTERGLLSMILIPAVISNLITLLRLFLELSGFGRGRSPRELTFWLALWPLILAAGVYFAYLLRDDQHPFRRLALALYVYGLSVRVLTAIIYGVSGALGWHTHYSDYGGGIGGYLLGVLFPQLVLWPLITVIAGLVTGLPALLILRAGGKPRPVSA